MKIAVIEDEKPIREGLVHILNKISPEYQVVGSAENGAEGLILLEEEMPEFLPLYHAVPWSYAVLAVISKCYPPVQGRLPTRYSPVRHSVTYIFPPKSSVACASFDLHVLGTPPAFILSQDQTLMLKSFFPASFIWHCLLLIRVASRSFSSICLFLNLAIHFSENLGIFRVALLFICQRSVILRCCCSQRQL